MKHDEAAEPDWWTQDVLILQLGPKGIRFMRVPHSLRRLPLLDQTAAHLREGFQNGRWAGQLPGVLQIAEELEVSKQIVRSALKILEEEGWIEDCGAGRRRKIVAQHNSASMRRSFRIGIMLNEPLENEEAVLIRILLSTRHAIESAGLQLIDQNLSLPPLLRGYIPTLLWRFD